MTPETILIRYAELCLKKNNRAQFEKQLKNNIEDKINPFNPQKIKRSMDGIRIKTGSDFDFESANQRLKKIPGLSWFANCWEASQDPDFIARKVLEIRSNLDIQGETLAVRTQRSNKSLPLNSEDYNQIIGEILLEQTDFEVDLDQPDWTIHVHLIQDKSYIFFEKFPGMRGLPVESLGSVLSLLSGGIDSPVASIELMKRGCRVDFVHFYAYPSARKALDAKIKELVNQLSWFNTSGKIHMVPYHQFDLNSLNFPRELELILFRRHTIRVSQAIARQEDHKALVTGESAGQVASQTLDNIRTVDAISNLPIYRPLIGMNKNNIVQKARRYGTYEISIKDYQDCCAIQAKRTKTTSNSDRMKALESNMNFKKLTEEAIDESLTYRFNMNGIEIP